MQRRIIISRSPDSSVDIVTSLINSLYISSRSNSLFSSLKPLNRCGPTQIPSTISSGAKVIGHRHLILKLRMSGCTPPLRPTPSCLFTDAKFVFLLLLTIWPRWLMPRMYCSHIGLLFYPQTFQISPLVSLFEVLAARGGDVHEPSYFRMFQLSPLVVFAISQQLKVELHGTRNGR